MRGKISATILVPGNMNAHVLGRLGAEFDLVRIARGDPALIAPEVAARVRGISAFSGVTADLIDALPALEIVANFGVGYDGVDAAHAGRKGILVTNTPDVLSDEVADTTIGLLINTLRELPKAEAYLRAGRWASEGAYPLTRLTLRGRSVGIYGLGRIGLAIARRLEGFGLPVAYHSRSPRDDVPYRYEPTLIGLAASVDTLIVIVPGNTGTEKTVDARVLAALGPDGVVINVGRGATIDHDALAAALADGTIAAAGLDVFPEEPAVPPALLSLPNVSLLPHVASASVATRTAMADLAVDNLRAWFTEGRVLTPVPETAHLVKA